jgi:hypothetical protein
VDRTPPRGTRRPGGRTPRARRGSAGERRAAAETASSDGTRPATSRGSGCGIVVDEDVPATGGLRQRRSRETAGRRPRSARSGRSPVGGDAAGDHASASRIARPETIVPSRRHAGPARHRAPSASASNDRSHGASSRGERHRAVQHEPVARTRQLPRDRATSVERPRRRSGARARPTGERSPAHPQLHGGERRSTPAPDHETAAARAAGAPPRRQGTPPRGVASAPDARHARDRRRPAVARPAAGGTSSGGSRGVRTERARPGEVDGQRVRAAGAPPASAASSRRAPVGRRRTWRGPPRRGSPRPG